MLQEIFSTYFENNTLKNESIELVANVTTAHNFLKASSVERGGNT